MIWEISCETLYFNPHLPYGRWPKVPWRAIWEDYISIHTFLTEGDVYSAILATPYQISIHTFLTEGDNDNQCLTRTIWGFQSTPSLRKVTNFVVIFFQYHFYFNPHLPYGRWRFTSGYAITQRNFNPHLPYGRWLHLSDCFLWPADISIHTFLTEGDRKNIYN